MKSDYPCHPSFSAWHEYIEHQFLIMFSCWIKDALTFTYSQEAEEAAESCQTKNWKLVTISSAEPFCALTLSDLIKVSEAGVCITCRETFWEHLEYSQNGIVQ